MRRKSKERTTERQTNSSSNLQNQPSTNAIDLGSSDNPLLYKAGGDILLLLLATSHESEDGGKEEGSKQATPL